PTPPLEVSYAQEPAPRRPPVPRVSWPIWRAYSVLGPCDVSQRIRLGSSHLRAPTIPATSALSPRTPTNNPGWPSPFEPSCHRRSRHPLRPRRPIHDVV